MQSENLRDPYRTSRSTSVPVLAYGSPDDEISLIDIWFILARHASIIGIIFGVAVVFGIAAVLLKPVNYKYSATVELGTYLTDRAQMSSVLIDQPETVLAKLQESYIPLALAELADADPDAPAVHQLTARVPKGSEVVLIEGVGPASAGAQYEAALQSVIAHLTDDHRRLMDVTRGYLESQLVRAKLELDALSDPSTLLVERRKLEAKLRAAEMELAGLEDSTTLTSKRKQLETQVTAARLSLEALKDPAVLNARKQEFETRLEQEKGKLALLEDQSQLLLSRATRLDETDQLLAKQIKQLEDRVAEASAQRRRSLSGISAESTAMAMLLIDNQLQDDRDRLARLEERLHIDQKTAREELETKLAENDRARSIQLGLIRQAELDLTEFLAKSDRSEQQKHAELAELEEKLRKLVADHERSILTQEPQVAAIREQLNKLSADNERSIARQRQEVSELETQIRNLKETHAIVPPMRSMDPVGSGKSVVVAIAAILGLMVGVFAAFFLEFLGKVRVARAEHEQMPQTGTALAVEGGRLQSQATSAAA